MPQSDGRISSGTPAFRRTNLALFAAGFSTFALLYCVQPLMPEFAREFHVSPASSSLALSLTTILLAVAMLLVGSVSEAWGRKPIMVASLGAAAVLTVISAAVRHWHAFLLLRTLEGIAFAGLPAIMMAYIGEEIHPGSVGLAMGLYIAGNGLGGMLGRLLTGVLTDLVSWRFAIGVIGALGIVASWVVLRSLPPSRHFEPRPLAPRALASSFVAHLADVKLLGLFAEGFLIMGGFVTMYNYISYRLLAPPYALSQSAVGLIFTVYLVGIFSSAWIGALAGRLGRWRTLVMTLALMFAGVLLTAMRPLAVVVFGIALLTFGFFGAHSVASSLVGLRATHAKAQASSLYLFFYYLGSSIAGAVGGLFWSARGWPGVVRFVSVMLVVGLALAVVLWHAGDTGRGVSVNVPEDPARRL